MGSKQEEADQLRSVRLVDKDAIDIFLALWKGLEIGRVRIDMTSAFRKGLEIGFHKVESNHFRS